MSTTNTLKNKKNYAKIIAKCNKDNNFSLPTISLSWKTKKDGNLFYFPFEGKLVKGNRYFDMVKGNRVLQYVAGGGYIHFVDYKYFEDAELLRITALSLKKIRGKDGEIHHPIIDEMYYFNKNRDVFNQKGELVSYHMLDVKFWLNTVTSYLHTSNMTNEFIKFIGDRFFYSAAGRKIDGERTWSIIDWYTLQKIYYVKDENKSITNAQNKHKKLLDIPLKNIANIVRNYSPVKERYEWNNITHGSFVEEAKNYTIIRTFNLTDYQEELRIYINNKNFKPIILRKINEGEWISAGIAFKGWNRIRTRLINIDEAKTTNLNWFIPILEEIECEKDKWIPTLLNFLKYPIIEKLYKAGYKNLAERFINGDYIKSSLESFFGNINLKETNLFKILKCNKFQLNLAEKELFHQKNNLSYFAYGAYLPDIIKNLKLSFKITDTSSLSDKEVLEIYEILRRGGKGYWGIQRYLNEGIVKNPQVKKVLRLLLKVSIKQDNKNGPFTTFNVFNDILKLNNSLNNEHRMGDELFANITSYNDLTRLHDNLQVLKDLEREEYNRIYNLERAKRNEELLKKMLKFDEERKQYEEENNDFCISLPSSPDDIVREGSWLHHCVGSYATEHAMGQTTILFLRKKEEKDVPFYTIELKGNQIAQIHGKYNQWLGNNPETILFVNQWCKKHGFIISDEILRSTAKGYNHRNAPLAEIPAV